MTRNQLVSVLVFHRFVVSGTSGEVGRGLCVVGPIGEIHALEGLGHGAFLGFARGEPFLLEPFGEAFASLVFGDGKGTHGTWGDSIIGGGRHHAGGAAEGAHGSGFECIVDGDGAALLALHFLFLLTPVEALGVQGGVEVHLTDFVAFFGVRQIARIATIVAVYLTQGRVEGNGGAAVGAFLIGFLFGAFRKDLFFGIVVVF